MTWFKSDDRFPEHPKVDALEAHFGRSWQLLNLALATWHLLGCDCAARRTDGCFDLARAQRVMRAPPREVERALDGLVAVGLLTLDGGVYAYHDWAEYQPTKAQLDEERKATARRQSEWRKRHSTEKNSDRNGVSNGVTNGVSNAAPTRPVPSRPNEEGEERGPPPPAVEGGVDDVRCGTVEVDRPADPATPTADAVLDLLARKSGGNLDARGTIDTLKHFKRAVDELRYPMLAWEHLAAQTALDPTRLWSSTYLLGRLNGQGGRVTLQLLLGRRLPDADPTRCAYDCAPLQEAINSARREALAREARTNG